MSKVNVQVGPGLPGLLTVLFVALKLTGHIAWSWLWVLSPIWLPIVVILGFLLLALFVQVVMAML